MGMSQMCAEADHYFRSSKPHSRKLCGEMENDEITAEVTETKETEAEKDEDNDGPIANVEQNEENPEDGELDPDSYGLDPQEKIDWSKLRTIFRYRPKTVDEEGYLSEEDIYNILIENKIHKDLASMLASMSLNVGC